MPSIALLIEFSNGRVKDASLGMATLVRRQNNEPVALVVDASAADAKAALEAVGVTRIVAVRSGADGWDPARQAAAVIAAMDRLGIDHLIGLTSPSGRELLPRIAARLDAPLIMDCAEIDLDAHRVTTSQYSGKAVASITLTGRRFVYGLRPNVVPPAAAPATAAIVDVAYDGEGDDGYAVLETTASGESGQDLAEAEVILSGGRGMKSAENFKLLHDCARHLNASVGASRVAVDNDWVPYAMQVGQTGVKVNPKVYIAAGISGSIQHFAGMKTAGTIIAINTDENAPIMAKCDYYAVADLFDILPALEKALAAEKG